MIRLLIATVIFVFCAGLAQAQNVDIIEKRKKTFEGIMPQVEVGKKFLKGDLAFDTAAAKTIFETYAAAAGELKSMFPEDTKTGGETRALPAIWEKKADFDARMAKFETDSRNAADTITDLASFKTAWGEVMSSCGGCHKPYRAEKK